MPRKRKQKFSFPILSRKEITKCLRELDIRLQTSDLTDPTKEKCQFIYAQILQNLLHINVHKQISNKTISKHFSTPSLHEQSILNICFCRELIRFMVRIGVPNFGISDVFSPDSVRTIRNLSAVINFAKFSNQQHRTYLQHKSVIDDLEKKLGAVTKQNADLAAKFVATQESIAEEKPTADKLQKKVDDTKKEMIRLNDEMEKNQLPKIHAVKKQIKALRIRDKQQQLILNNHIDEIEHLEPQIVRSPQRIKKELKLRSKRIEKQTIEVAGSKVKYSRDFRKLNVLKGMDVVIKQRIEEMKQLHALREQHRGLEDQLRGLKVERRKVTSEIHAIQRSKKTIKENLTSNKKTYQGLKMEKEMKQGQVNQLLQSVRKEQDRTSRRNISRREQISRVQHEIMTTKEDIKQVLDHHEKNIEMVREKYNEMVKTVDGYHDSMREGMETWS